MAGKVTIKTITICIMILIIGCSSASNDSSDSSNDRLDRRSLYHFGVWSNGQGDVAKSIEGLKR